MPRRAPVLLSLSLALLFAGLYFVAMETSSKRLSREGRLGGDASSGKLSCAPARAALSFPVPEQTSPKPPNKIPYGLRSKTVSLGRRIKVPALVEKHGGDAAVVLQSLPGDR